ncbi:hypothetical protein SteCoe_10737 [Stentor coeruleus]|uniref:Mitogen-activated protein kinase n=1 Tax=Stentor coeruleus TaxID=5963 RepID=A0A1R2CEV3_9CILI|nr:hypothetical protein SteCoe_10737 [Stentor coeruleus]
MSKSKSAYSISELKGPCANNGVLSKVMGSNFILDRRYTVLNTIGSGAYGVVVSAHDSITGENVAIKKIEKAFEHATFAKRTLRELKILRLLSHENIIRIKTIQLPSSREDFEEIYLVSELMETDLSSIIKSPQALSDEHCQFFLYQLLRGLKFMHSACILHRDLKPRNLLVNSNCDLKICDFGLARPSVPELRVKSSQMTDYVATRWYRAPEVLLTFKKYTAAMDMWSVGCIFGELLLRKPLLPGTDANHQIDLIINLLGFPSEEDIQSIPNVKAREKLLKMNKRNAKCFEIIFRDANPQAIDLLKKLLVFNPEKRYTVDQALNHPYLSALHFPDDEPFCHPVSMFDFEFERLHLNMNDFKDLIYDEILLHHFTSTKQQYEKAKSEYDAHAQLPVRRYSRDKETDSENDEPN